MMKSLSPSTRNNIMTCLVVLLIVGLILWLTFKTDDKKYKSCPKPAPAVVPSPSKILIPIGNGQSVALTREEYQRLSQAGSSKEGFYVSSQEYIPSVQTENEYIPMNIKTNIIMTTIFFIIPKLPLECLYEVFQAHFSTISIYTML